MKSFGIYISKHLAAFMAFILMILFINAAIFSVTFYKIFTEDYGETSPRIMLKMTATTASQTGLSEETKQKLHQNNIWAIYLDQNGQSLWSFDLPKEVPESYTITIEIMPNNETAVLKCDARLISRAINNIVQNSIKHNPQGCDITIILEDTGTSLLLTVTDNGVGLSPEKLQELKEKPHYMESTDERLDLRHGLELILVRQIVEAHHGSITIESIVPHGCKTIMSFPK